MKRTQIQLDEASYRLLRAEAFARHISLAALLRELVDQHLRGAPTSPARLEDFTFIGAGRSKKSGLEPISERHDEALAEDFGY